MNLVFATSLSSPNSATGGHRCIARACIGETLQDPSLWLTLWRYRKTNALESFVGTSRLVVVGIAGDSPPGVNEDVFTHTLVLMMKGSPFSACNMFMLGCCHGERDLNHSIKESSCWKFGTSLLHV